MAQFDDGKDAGALRTIGEVSAALDIKPHVLRYWEDQFPQLSPLKRAGGRRLYRPEDVALIQRIDALVNQEGYTLKGAKGAIRDAPASDKTVRESEGISANMVARLKALRATLTNALSEAA